MKEKINGLDRRTSGDVRDKNLDILGFEKPSDNFFENEDMTIEREFTMLQHDNPNVNATYHKAISHTKHRQ